MPVNNIIYRFILLTNWKNSTKIKWTFKVIIFHNIRYIFFYTFFIFIFIFIYLFFITIKKKKKKKKKKKNIVIIINRILKCKNNNFK